MDISTPPSTPRLASRRKSSKEARRKIRNYARDMNFFKTLRARLSEQNKSYDMACNGLVLMPSRECDTSCMKEWGEGLKCSHDVKTSTWCDRRCLSRFKRYRFCKHAMMTCSFCKMPTGRCECFDTDGEDECEER